MHGIIPLNSILTNRHIGTVGACPICHQDAEDVRHLLFDCCHARELWKNLGVSKIIDEAKRIDRSGYVIMEHLILAPDVPLAIKPNLNIKQVVLVGFWYLWWIRRQFTHNGAPPPPTRWHMAVLAITNNY